MRRRDLLSVIPMTLAGSVLPAAAPHAPVVLELFTSEGCSSCPPADALLGELSREAGVIALAWHVDYWNSLGWRDPFARPEWTDRQKTYADRLGTEVFTPALVLNGTTMLVGSREAVIRRAISQTVPPPLAVALHHGVKGLEANVAPIDTAAVGILVIYDAERSTDVGAGENQGRRLREFRIVRDVISISRITSRMTFPEVPQGRGAALLIQDPAWRILGAADLPVSRDL